MKKIFVDTNILLDVFLAREPFYQAAQILWALLLKKDVKAAISAISVNNCFFIINKLAGPEKAYVAIDALSDFFSIIDLDAGILNRARRARFSDFENAVQYFSAKKFSAQAIISRDLHGFEKDDVAVMDVTQFLAAHSISAGT